MLKTMGFIKKEEKATQESGNHKATAFPCFLVRSLLGAATLAFGFGRSYRHWVIECDASHSVPKSLSSSATFTDILQMLLPSHGGWNRMNDDYPSSFDQWLALVEKQRRIRMEKIIYSKGEFSNLMRSKHKSVQEYPPWYTSWSEAMVHPAMLSHSNPKRIAVIGRDQNDLTLKEVLKYTSVESVTVFVREDKSSSIELQDCVTEQSGCNELLDRMTQYADDPRVRQRKTEDVVKWLTGHYRTTDARLAEKYDVVFLEPEATYQSKEGACDTTLLDVLSDALRENGILVACVHSDLPIKSFDGGCCEHERMQALQEAGFESLIQYSEDSLGILGNHKFVIAFMDENDRHRWFRNQAEIDLSVRKLTKSTSMREPPLGFFDGATMMTYQYPSRLVEEQFCSTSPTPLLCDHGHGFDPERPVIPITDLTVKPSTIPNAGRGLFVTKSVAKNSYLATEEEVHDILVMPSTYAVHSSMLHFDPSGPWNVIETYTQDYGFCSYYYGGSSWSIDPNILCFMNHGCNGTYNLNSKDSVTEMNADPDTKPSGKDPMEQSSYNPFLERNHLIFMHGYDITNSDIETGGEILGNYMDYIDGEDWKQEVEYLKAECLGQEVGEVKEYEEQNKSTT